MKIDWQDLPERKNYFTSRNTAMVNLDNKASIQQYAANTKIAVVQKCITEGGTFFRTESAKNKGLNWAFKASAFGLPDEKAPSAPSPFSIPEKKRKNKPASRTPKPETKQKNTQKKVLPKDGEAKSRRSWVSRIFRRVHG